MSNPLELKDDDDHNDIVVATTSNIKPIAMQDADMDTNGHCESSKSPTHVHPFDPADDPLHVDFNEDMWLPCMPKVSLTMATMIAAFLGIGIGLAISLSPPQTVMVDSTETVTRNITVSDVTNVTNIANVASMQIVDGEFVLFYEETVNTTVEMPYSHMNAYVYAVVEFPGKLWINALKLLVLPLITMMMLVLPSRVEAIGPLGKIAIPLYLFTSTCAAIQGSIWAWVIQPGNLGRATTDAISASVSTDIDGEQILVTDAIFNVLYNAVPPNIIVAMSDLMVLGIICFFLAIGVLLRHPNVKECERVSVLNVSQAILRCTMLLVVWVIWFTPIGMLSLICLKVASTTDLLNLMGALGFYLLCVAVGHTIHTFLFYPLLFWCTTRLNGWKYYVKIFAAPVLAFATSSSAATLPRSIQVAEEAGVRKEVYSFIIPLGAAINMDGTALGFPIMIGLIAQLHGISLDFGQIVVVLILSVVISIGTAPIPNVGMVYLTMLFEAAGIGELAGEGIATLFVLDWLVDRIETAVNVTSDQYVAKMTDVLDQRSKLSKEKICCWWCRPTSASEVHGYQPTETEITEMT